METPATSSSSTSSSAKRSSTAHTLTVDEFSVLLERCQRPLYTFLRDLVGDDEQARDLVQDTFYSACRAHRDTAPPFDTVRPEPEVRRWLFRVAYHSAVSLLRRRKLIHWGSLNAPHAAEHLDAPATAFTERLVERDAVRVALAALAPTDAACLTLIVVHGFTAADAGQIIGSSAQAVAKRFSRAKQRLRSIYLAQNQQAEERHLP